MHKLHVFVLASIFLLMLILAGVLIIEYNKHNNWFDVYETCVRDNMVIIDNEELYCADKADTMYVRLEIKSE